MRALVGDKWIPGLLDPTRAAGEVLIDVSAWVALRPVDGLYFSAERDWRRVLRYAREFGVRRVLDKIRSRRAESGRNEKFLCVGEGIVREADEGSPFRVGDAVRFVAPAHPRSVDRACLSAALVRPTGTPAGQGRAADSAGPNPAWEALAGWNPCAGAALEPSLVDAVLDSAQALLASAPRGATGSAASSPITRRAQSRRAPRPGTLRAAVFGLGHYAKTNLIPNLPSGIEVTEIREIDPLQVGPIDQATLSWSVSTDPGMAAGDRFAVVCAAGFHHTHAPLAVSALAAGSWAIVEKPIATTRPQLDALLGALAAHPGRLFACFHKRFDPLNAWARADLGVAPGEAIHYKAIVFEVPLPARHWYRWPASGSRIVSNGCHWIDHFLFLNGWSRPVASSASRASNGDITCLAELENGASFTLVLTDHGSARLGVRDHVELRARDTTIVIEDGSAYHAERTSGLIRHATLSRRETYSRMYQSIGGRILAGAGGDSLESVERSAGLVLDLEEKLVTSSRPGRASTPAASTLGVALLALLLSACGGESPEPKQATTSPATSRATRAGAQAPDLSRPPDFLLISIDTLRADHLGCLGDAGAATPFIDSLAREGVLFRQATSAVPITLPSHATMLTGLSPARHGARDNTGSVVADDIVTLTETLRDAGYQTGAFIGALPLAKAGGLAQGFDVYDDAIPERALGSSAARREERTADEVLAAASAWLATTDPSRPTFAFVHLFDPHAPYEKPSPGTNEPSYAGEIAFVDRSLEGFVSTLRREPRWRSLVTILTSDHGEGLGEHGEATHCIFVYQSTMHVPLIVNAPGRFTPRVVDDVVGLIDLTPTLQEVAGVALLPGLDGRSLAAALRGEPLAARDYAVESLFGALNFGWAPLRGIRSGSLKLIDAPRPELFDLASDPHETANIHAGRADDVAQLTARLVAPAGADSGKPRSGTPATQEDRDRMEGLAALGYVSARPAAGSQAKGARPDPKDCIADYEAFQRAHAEFASGRRAEAVATMQSVEGRFARSPYFYLELGNFAGAMGDLKEAARGYEKCLELDPANSDARLNMGVIRLETNDARGALAHFEALLAREPDHAEAHLYAGVVLGQRLDDEVGAIAHWKRFVELAPSHPEAAKIRAVVEKQGGR